MDFTKLIALNLIIFCLSSCGGGGNNISEEPVRKMVENYNGAGDPGPIAAIAGDFPNDYRSKAKTYLKRHMKDPHSFKDGKIATPFYVGRLFPSWIVCVQGRSKNGYGAYSGLKFFEIHMRNGEILPHLTDEGEEAWWCNRSEHKLEFSKFTL